MADEKQLREASEFLDRLEEFLAYPDDEEDAELVRQRLIEDGLDPDATVARVCAYVEKKKKERIMDSWKEGARRMNAAMDAKLKAMTQGFCDSRDEMLRRINDVVARKRAQAFFRNMNPNEMSDEELAGFLARLEMLENGRDGTEGSP